LIASVFAERSVERCIRESRLYGGIRFVMPTYGSGLPVSLVVASNAPVTARKVFVQYGG
jgi:hypothetical protein